MIRVILCIVCWTACAFAQDVQPAKKDADKSATPSSASTTVTMSERAEAVKKKPEMAVGADAYNLKVTQLQGRVNTLKEKIYRTKTQLFRLKEDLLSTSIAGSEVRIVHRNEMGSSFRLEKIIYSLDGQPLQSSVDTNDLGENREMQIFDGPVTPGNHTLSVVMVYRGNGFGIFSYLRGYVFTLRNSYTFHAEEGKRIQVNVVGYEKGGMTTDLKDRPDIRFDPTVSRPNGRDRGPTGNQ
ncbi:MAG: dihydrolipoamide acetyltransferase [Myxococcota bacterium]|nr:dihydrolipoamide acetyltransferase [Myxococcota bacterium]